MSTPYSTPGRSPGLVVLAVDDERSGIDMLDERLNGNRHVRRVIKAFDASEALRVLHGADEELAARKRSGLPLVDAVFADIQMPGLTGIELAKVLTGFNPAPALVIVTGNGPEAAFEAIQLGAVDYLTKPYDQPRFDQTIDRVLTKLRGEGHVDGSAAGQRREVEEAPPDDEVIPVELAGNTKLISRKTVRYVEAQGDYARLHTNDGGSHLVRIPLSQLEERWAKAGFIRIHRSYLVPLRAITELQMTSEGYKVLIGHDGKVLPVSRRHTRELKERLVKAPRNGYGSA